MNDTDPAHLQEAQTGFEALMPNIKAFDSDNPKAKLASGEVAIGYCWNAEAALAMLDNPASNLPDEIFAKGEYILDVGETTTTYDEIWTAVKGG